MEKLTLTGKKDFKKRIFAPPSKSYSHRMILSAALSDGISRIENLIFSKDVLATLDFAKKCGAYVFRGENFAEIKGGTAPDEAEIFCGESASTLRFVIPVLAAKGIKAHITGAGRLMHRPLDVYTEIFDEKGINYRYEKGEFFDINSCIPSGIYNVRGDVSSQFITGLLYALPLLSGNSEINITTPLMSKPYIDITLDVLKRSGIEIENDNFKTFKIKKNQKYLPLNAAVPGDFSQCCPFVAAALFAGHIEMLNLDLKSLQGDKKIIEYSKALGGRIFANESKITVEKSNLTSGKTFDISDCPDIAPVFSVICAHAEGETILTGTNRLKIKECDREAAIVSTLKKLGAECSAGDDYIKIKGVKTFNGGTFDSFNDHRTAMALCAASVCANEKITVLNPMCIEKSYPSFYDDFKDFTYQTRS